MIGTSPSGKNGASDATASHIPADADADPTARGVYFGIESLHSAGQRIFTHGKSVCNNESRYDELERCFLKKATFHLIRSSLTF